MNKVKIFILLLIVTVVSFGLTGCNNDQEHPSTEHPSTDHPTEDHPQSQNKTGEHPK